MNARQRAKEVANQMRSALASQPAKQLMEQPDVCGAGLAWRSNGLMFVVRTDSLDKAGSLRAKLPSMIEGFPLTVEMEDLAQQTSAERWQDRDRHPRWAAWFGRLLRFFGCQRDWLAFAARES